MREVVIRHVYSPFSWGGSDCAFVFECVAVMTGFDALHDIRGYSTEAGALKALKRAGFDTVLDLVAASFEEIHPGFAGRGDIGYPSSIPHPLMSPAIIDGANAFSKDPFGGVVLPRSAIARAWAV